MSKPKIDRDLHQSFVQLVADNVGFASKNLDRAAVAEKLLIRIKALNLVSPEAYYRLLQSSTRESQKEWQNLVTLLTNKETYFFRDQEQIKLLRAQILPELIKHKQNSKTLRICSAGCSTGEEPYSLAILLKELIPNLSQWNLTLLGIDIDEAALEQAKAAIYTPWSFRGVNEDLKQRYFKKIGNRYHLNLEIKQLVSFKTINLLKDSFPQKVSDLREIDLFICRNVFIYFDSQTIANILDKIYNTLHPQGYFMSGHTELHRQDLSKFQKQLFPESVLYRRQEAKLPQEKVRAKLNLISPPLEKVAHSNKNLKKRVFEEGFGYKKSISERKYQQASPAKSLSVANDKSETEALETAKDFYYQQNYGQAIEDLKKFLSSNPQSLPACHLIATVYANLGNYETAIRYCHQALDIDAFYISAHYLLAQIAEEQGKLEAAKQILKKIIYLDPNHAIAYLDLSQIYHREGDKNRALKMQQTALDLLSTLPANTKIEEKGVTAAELIYQLNQAP